MCNWLALGRRPRLWPGASWSCGKIIDVGINDPLFFQVSWYFNILAKISQSTCRSTKESKFLYIWHNTNFGHLFFGRFQQNFNVSIFSCPSIDVLGFVQKISKDKIHHFWWNPAPNFCDLLNNRKDCMETIWIVSGWYIRNWDAVRAGILHREYDIVWRAKNNERKKERVKRKKKMKEKKKRGKVEASDVSNLWPPVYNVLTCKNRKKKKEKN
jgi:hypothetical protein